jgi:hypothetical protein
VSASTTIIPRTDDGSGRPIIDVVVINPLNVIVVPPDNPSRTITTYFLGDDAVQTYPSDIAAVELRTIPKEVAKEQVLSYVKSHIGCRTGDVIYDLELDPDLVIECLKELESEHRVKGKDIDRA